MHKTLNYYDQNAQEFVLGTLEVKFTDIQDKFLLLVPDKGCILDFGCGSGRDTKYFLSKGYKVDATDGSESLCEIASQNTGINVRWMLFNQLEEHEKYDGIWACASILHLTKSELQDVFPKMIRAVKTGGVIYASFKYGEFEGYRGERYFTDFTEGSFKEFVSFFSGITIAEEWVSSDVRPGRDNEKWLNIILRKSSIG